MATYSNSIIPMANDGSQVQIFWPLIIDTKLGAFEHYLCFEHLFNSTCIFTNRNTFTTELEECQNRNSSMFFDGCFIDGLCSQMYNSAMCIKCYRFFLRIPFILHAGIEMAHKNSTKWYSKNNNKSLRREAPRKKRFKSK